MKEYELKISTPDGNFFQGNVVALYVNGTEGQLAILAGHIPFITAIKEGAIRLEFDDMTEKIGASRGGVLTVDKDKVTLISSTFSWE